MTPQDPYPGEQELSSHSFFVPMVDLLAGVVFLLVIMLAASVLVSRPDFGKAQSMQTELRRIAAELETARAAEHLLLDPRRQADRDRRLLLERLAGRLAGRGYQLSVDAERGTVAVEARDAFRDGAIALEPAGQALAAAVGDALAAELPCLAVPATNADGCAGYGDARLETVEVLASPSRMTMPAGGAVSTARALSLQLLSSVAAAHPALVALAGERGVPLMTYGEGASGAAEGPEGLVLRFQMALPPIP
ncbi:MAG: hypothetical protein JNL61_03750 [Rhizobiaceae bacterium]|nr:hypothetical protein [Rhizobiaceae bacterium]